MSTYSSNSSYSSSSDNPIAGAIGLGVMGISIWALVCGARILLASVSILIDVVFGSALPEIVTTVVLSALAGAFAAICIALLRSLGRKTGSTSKSFVSALFNKNLAAPSLDVGFWGRVLIGGLIGLLVGAMTGASGAISFPQMMNGSAAPIVSAIPLPLIDFLAGGFGGPGGTGFWSLAFLVLVIILMALAIGILSGLIIHLLIAAVAGGTKGATKELLLRTLEEPNKSDSRRHPIVDGIARGALAGVIVGIIEAIFTVWGIVGFRPPG